MNRPLRIVHLTLGLDLGGQEKLLVEFARHANRRRVALHVVSLTDRGALADELEKCGCPVTALEAPRGLRPGLILKLARLFARLKADLVHTHDDRPNIYGAPAARLIGAKVVHTRHSAGQLLSARQRWLVKLVSRLCHRFVCISEDSARQARLAGVPRRLVRVIHNGIDLERFPFTGPDPNGPALLVARLAPEKDIGTLLRAVALVRGQRPDFALQIAGDGPCREELLQVKATLNLNGGVHFLGARRDVPDLLKRSRLFVLSSLTEGISLTLLEAMAAGVPIVATQVGGNPEVVAQGQTGILVPKNQPEALAEGLRVVWDDAARGRAMGVAGRARVEQHFDIRRMVVTYEALYDEVMGL